MKPGKIGPVRAGRRECFKVKEESNFDTEKNKQARNTKMEHAPTISEHGDEGVYPVVPKIEIDVDVSDNLCYYHVSSLDSELMKQYGIRQCFVTLTDSYPRKGGKVEHQTSNIFLGTGNFNDTISDEMKPRAGFATNRPTMNDEAIANASEDVEFSGKSVPSGKDFIKSVKSQSDARSDLTYKSGQNNHQLSKHERIRGYYEPNLQCPACLKTFKATKLMRDHKAKAHGNRVYRCTRCDKWFSTRQKLDNHINVHLNRRPHKCSTCNATFTSNKNLCRHLKNHTVESKRKFVCPNCPKRFNTRRHLESHIRMHTNDRRFKCSECDKTYKYDAQLRIHHRLHTGQRFYCEVCKKPFIDKADLKRHLISHSDLRPYKCDTCGAAFKRKGVLNAHISRHGDLFNIAKDECRICGQTFKFKYYLKKHMEIHDPHRPSFKCHLCGKVVATQGSLRLHMKNSCSHLEHSEYLCEICGKTLRTKANLRKHKKHHTDGYKYPCKRCDKSYAFSYHLQRHTRKAHDHTEEKRGTKCRHCSHFVVDMDMHVEKHHTAATTKRYECSTCGKIMNYKHNFKAHEDSHLGVKHFRCDHCQWTFAQKRSLIMHIERKHIVSAKRLEPA